MVKIRSPLRYQEGKLVPPKSFLARFEDPLSPKVISPKNDITDKRFNRNEAENVNNSELINLGTKEFQNKF